MRFIKYTSLFSAIIALLMVIITLVHGGQNALLWFNIFCWSLTTFFGDLITERKEKKLKEIEDVIISSKDEVEAINKIKKII